MAPVGRLEPGETLVEGAIRETIEETGVPPHRAGESGRDIHSNSWMDTACIARCSSPTGCEGTPVEKPRKPCHSGAIPTRSPTTACGRMIATGFRCF